jgi:uncharacterized protein (DUF2252 family)
MYFIAHQSCVLKMNKFSRVPLCFPVWVYRDDVCRAYLSEQVTEAQIAVAKEEKMAILHDSTVTPRDDRRARGKVLAGAVPHEKHAKWEPAAKRLDPVEILLDQDEGRVPELVPIRYGRMTRSPHTFFRGAAAVMAADLATTPISKVKVQLCGDCHALNFGAFATPERNIVFDINDFDETLPGPWEWDLKRLTTSAVLIARENGLKKRDALAAAEAVGRAYRTRMNELASLPILEIWYAKVDWEETVNNVTCAALKQNLEADLKKAQKKTSFRTFPKLAQSDADGNFRIKDNPPLIYHPPDMDDFLERVKHGMVAYKESLQDDKRHLIDRYQIVDAAVKVVGIGSVGTMCSIVLMVSPDGEPLILQVKQATNSVLEKYAGKSEFENHGQRVVTGQRVVQSASDIFLGWLKAASGRHFYVRQLRDTKVKLNTETWEASHLIKMCTLFGEVLAKAHARSGDAATLSGYMGDGDTFEKALASFAVQYADQTEQDYELLLEAVKDNRVQAQTVE